MNTAIVFSDNCMLDNMSIFMGEPTYEIVQENDNSCTSATTVMVQATDVNGNMATRTVHIALQDNTAPELTVPAELTFLTSEFGSGLDDVPMNMEFKDSLLANPDFSVSDNCTDSDFMIENNLSFVVINEEGTPIGFNGIMPSCDVAYRVAVDVMDQCGGNLSTDTVLVSLIDDVQPLLNFTGRAVSYTHLTLPTKA